MLCQQLVQKNISSYGPAFDFDSNYRPIIRLSQLPPKPEIRLTIKAVCFMQVKPSRMRSAPGVPVYDAFSNEKTAL